MASQPSTSHFFDRITEQTIDDFQVFNQALIEQARLVRNDTDIIIIWILHIQIPSVNKSKQITMPIIERMAIIQSLRLMV